MTVHGRNINEILHLCNIFDKSPTEIKPKHVKENLRYRALPDNEKWRAIILGSYLRSVTVTKLHFLALHLTNWNSYSSIFVLTRYLLLHLYLVKCTLHFTVRVYGQ